MRILLIMVIAGLLLGAGCGDDAGDKASQDDGQTAMSTTAESDKPDSDGGDGCIVASDEMAAALGADAVTVASLTAPESQTRCTYTVTAAAGAGDVFVMWTMPPEDFYLLKDVEDDLTGDISGLGDDAFIAYHPDDQRYDIYALVEGKITIEVTGSDEAAVRKVVELALAQY